MIGFSLFFDPTMILLVIGGLIASLASWNVNQTFDKYSRYDNRLGLTGTEVAERMLASYGIRNVKVTRVSGKLTDYYDPAHKELRLSDRVADAQSISAIGVAAHECGHALQDANDYAFMRIREHLVPIVNIGSNMSMPILLFGLLLGMNATLIHIGIFLFSFALIFQLATLPVEFNASYRAIQALENLNLLETQELPYAKKTLQAAALTYVAGTLASLISLLRIIIIFTGNDRD